MAVARVTRRNFCILSTLRDEVKPVLEKLATDTDMDVKYFAQEAISGKHIKLNLSSFSLIPNDENITSTNRSYFLFLQSCRGISEATRLNPFTRYLLMFKING